MKGGREGTPGGGAGAGRGSSAGPRWAADLCELAGACSAQIHFLKAVRVRQHCKEVWSGSRHAGSKDALGAASVFLRRHMLLGKRDELVRRRAYAPLGFD